MRCFNKLLKRKEKKTSGKNKMIHFTSKGFILDYRRRDLEVKPSSSTAKVWRPVLFIFLKIRDDKENRTSHIVGHRSTIFFIYFSVCYFNRILENREKQSPPPVLVTHLKKFLMQLSLPPSPMKHKIVGWVRKQNKTTSPPQKKPIVVMVTWYHVLSLFC